ncbi:MAG: PEP-CTERM sorting domain-containing protein, partial [Pirellulales bacterium]|nr:PEP-CTERM sorting domain-containing protein [Pirellulales bacterium]
ERKPIAIGLTSTTQPKTLNFIAQLRNLGYANVNKRTYFESSIVVKSLGVLDVSDWSGFNIPDGRSLSGTGSVVGDVLVAAGGSIEPGESVGALTATGNVTVAGGFEVEYDSDVDTIDKLAVTGDLDLADATVTFADLGAGSLAPGTYVFALCTGTFTAPASPPTPPSGATIDWAYNSGQGAALVVVPEPSVLILLSLAGLALAAWRRRR